MDHRVSGRSTEEGDGELMEGRDKREFPIIDTIINNYDNKRENTISIIQRNSLHK